MISSVSNNSSAVWQTGYSQRQSAAFSTTNPDQDVQQDPALKTDASASTGDKKPGNFPSPT